MLQLSKSGARQTRARITLPQLWLAEGNSSGRGPSSWQSYSIMVLSRWLHSRQHVAQVDMHLPNEATICYEALQQQDVVCRGLGGGQHVVLFHLCGAPGCQLRPARAVAEPHPASDAAHCAVLPRLCYSEPPTPLLIPPCSYPLLIILLLIPPCSYPIAHTPLLIPSCSYPLASTPMLDPCRCAALKSSLACCKSQSALLSTMIHVSILMIAKYQVSYGCMQSNCYATVVVHEGLPAFSSCDTCLQPRLQGSLGCRSIPLNAA